LSLYTNVSFTTLILKAVLSGQETILKAKTANYSENLDLHTIVPCVVSQKMAVFFSTAVITS